MGQQKLKTDPITEVDITKYFQEKDHFGLEVRTCAELRKHNLRVSHAGKYTDPITQKVREYDIRGILQWRHFRIFMSVECKAIQPSLPIVIAETPRTKEEERLDVLYKRASYNQLARVTNPEIYHRGFVGRSIRQIGHNGTGDFTDKDSESFSGWSQSLSASDQFLRDEFNLSVDKPSLLFLMPCLVVPNNTLWSVEFDSTHANDFETPKNTDTSTLFVGGHRIVLNNSGSTYEVSHVHIFTEDGLKQWLDRYTRNFHIDLAWEEIFSKDVQERATGFGGFS